MTEPELRELIASHEADRVEFTETTSNIDKLSEAVCSFANDLPGHGVPGHLVIGVDDRKTFRRIEGFRRTPAQPRRLAR
jgi:ATP-dependent DNA helicase RecG